jgi:hypothetical protein
MNDLQTHGFHKLIFAVESYERKAAIRGAIAHLPEGLVSRVEITQLKL